jgi:hypothetical protein
MDTPDTERNSHRYLVLVMRLPAFDAAVIEPHRRFLDELRAVGLLELHGRSRTNPAAHTCCVRRRLRTPTPSWRAIRSSRRVRRGSVYEWAAT